MASPTPSGESFYVIRSRGFLASSLTILLAFASPLLIFIAMKIGGWSPYVAISGLVDFEYRAYVGVNWLAIFSCASLFGAIGVMVSLVLRREIDERLVGMHTFALLLVVYSLGAIFGMLILCLFVGGFLQGSLFPRFENGSWTELNFRSRDWGQLAIWAFLAGFSERLMPSLFDQIFESVGRVGSRNSDNDGPP